ncbi:hypothetical protein NKG05_01155 [Oerskovia sp. M15]
MRAHVRRGGRLLAGRRRGTAYAEACAGSSPRGARSCAWREEPTRPVRRTPGRHVRGARRGVQGRARGGDARRRAGAGRVGGTAAPGRRLSESGMAAVVEITRREIAPVVSLYVNAYNERALATYRRVGFEQVGTFATVLF